MHQLGIAAIAGNRTRPSMFTMNAVDTFNPSMMGGYSMGQTGQQIYARAKAAIATFDALVGRTAKIANKSARQQVIDTYGLSESGNKDKALYMRNAVAGNVGEVESYTPPNYLIYETRKGPDAGRVDKLEAFNRNFASDVKTAEDTYGILPEPVVIEKLVMVAGEPAASTMPGWVLPVGVVVVGVGIAAAFGVFSKK
jgi:hypothetical protein